MATDHHEFVGHGPVSDWNARHSGHGYGTRHTWHHGDRDSGVGTCQHFFIAPGEHEGVAPFETDHKVAGSGPFDQDSVDRVLGHGPAVRDLGRVDDFYVRRQLGQQFGRGEPVGDHDIGLGKQPATANRDQFGIAGTAADQRHSAAEDVGTLRSDDALLQRLPDCRADRRRTAVLTTGEHPHRQARIAE
ncbi:Uncharacterised protein [Mycobacterium tuberculosis]|nr:Uncharacterised protein [Mycobacterium tuberculosis]